MKRNAVKAESAAGVTQDGVVQDGVVQDGVVQNEATILQSIAQQFAGEIAVVAVDPYGAGNVNDTYLVQLAAAAPHIGGAQFVLQRINRRVFREPELILTNMRTFLRHIDLRLQQAAAQPKSALDQWRMPRIISTAHGADAYHDPAQDCWRAITLIAGAKTYPQIRNRAHARESGYALGRFHSLLSDLDPNQLHDTLPGFHITPRYLAGYDQVQASETAQQRQAGEEAAVVAELQRFIAERRHVASVLEDAAARGELQLRAIHGDPKVDNILIDDQSARAVSIIDLDTVKPGLVHYDIGDALRSCCNPAGEETKEVANVRFDIELCNQILAGYLAETAGFFTDADYAYIYDSIHLITFELGLRFFSDYLAGDRYFKIAYPEHNLQRARVQFQLVASIEAEESAIRQLVTEHQVAAQQRKR